MTGNVNLGTLKTSALEQYDFSSIRNTMDDKIQGLLDQEGAFSLDSRGELIVVNPPKKRDNCIYRFFKGLFNSQYKEQQQQFDKVTALQKNASFNTILRENLTKSIAAKNSSGVSAETDQEKEQKVSAMLTDLFSWKSNNVTLKDVKLMTIAQKSSSGKAGIPIKGESLTPAEFITKYASHLKPNNSDSHMTHAILSRITAHPEDFACLGMEEKAAALKTLMSQPGTKGIQAKINQHLKDIMAEINDKMSAFAEKALSSGKDANAVARKLADIYDRLCSPATGNQKTDRAFMTKIFGENGALSKISNLEKAKDAQSYARTDPGFRYSDAMAKIKEQLPDLTDKQLGEIVRGLSGSYKNDISDNAITQLVNIKNALPKMSETQLLQVFDHLSGHGTKEITPEALKQYADIFKAGQTLLTAIQDLQSKNTLQTMKGISKLTNLFQQVTGMTIKPGTDEHMKEFFSHVGHALPIASSVNSNAFVNAGITPEGLTALNGLKTAFKSSLNSMSETMSPDLKSNLELKFGFVNAFLDEIKNHMSTGNDHTAIIDPDAEPAQPLQEKTDRLVKLAVLRADKTFNEKIDRAVSDLNLEGPNAQKIVRLMIRDLTFCGLNKNNDPLNDYEPVLADVTRKIKDDDLFIKLLSVDAITADHLKKVVDKIATPEILNDSYNKELKSPQHAVTETTIHKVFLRDTLGVIKIQGADTTFIHGDEARKKIAADAFKKIVPEEFRGYVSCFAMQGGLSQIIEENLTAYDESDKAPRERIHPLIPSGAEVIMKTKCGANVFTGTTSSISKRDEDTLEIRTAVSLYGGPGQNFAEIADNKMFLTNGMNGGYKLATFEMVHVINLKAGVETVNGIKNVPKDMKLESITLTSGPQQTSNVDF